MQSIRNVAIIAHVDHGKTTLVDKIIHASQIFREGTETGDLILDNQDLEKERGITITSKNVSVRYKGIKINIIDTPGHSDFGGEVERVLKMADGVLLLVDAFEGPMPQTRFVLSKALSLGLKPIVVINKVDKENCRPDEVHEQVFDLMFNLDATEDQLDFQTLYGSSKHGWMSTDWKQQTDSITPLLDAIVEFIPPAPVSEGDPQMQITSLDYSNYVGRIAIGRVKRGEIKEGANLALSKKDGSLKRIKIREVQTFEGLGKTKVESVGSGDICALVGIEDFDLGDTVTTMENPDIIPRIAIDEPTMSMLFTINNSPFFGKEGKFVTSRHLRDRLFRETEKNLALRIEETSSEDKFNVFGRGILHLSVLIETMRREGYELQVGQPQVLIKEIDGVKSEPIEHLVVDVPQETSGKVIELVTQRKGELKIMEPKGDLQHLEFDIPARGIIGLRNNVLTSTAGEAIMTHRFSHYAPFKGEIPGRINGSLIAMESGPATAYSIDKLQDRGVFFVDPGDDLYEGQVIGEHSRENDLVVNVQKGKKLTNMRASGSDNNVKIAPAKKFSLEEALEYIQKDEYLEVTPKSIRMRKILLTENERKRAGNAALSS
ncbi:translational GTPase TypA [Fulvivirga sedimenti]|uniref:Large ribosomal subunit assembly factor BipA n=1 Tax=Fulvivirga sedimenti TaxID=2879465 RepID=A0A9X1HKF2_9BACT|nr:translational GTPase TypA [Fulvivirga sedimenti]MCA6073783.1 translational GTPase TypA [Fulvivirga sedimenti]